MIKKNTSSKPRKKSFAGFSAAEREAMQERALELRSNKDGESTLLAKVAAMPPADRVIAKRLHALIKANAPMLSPKTWYGMPAYANEDEKVVCFFQGAFRFKARYATLGFNDAARLDEGNMWPTTFALKKLTAAEEKKIVALIKKAVRE